MKGMHPSVWNDLKIICEDAFTGVWLGSTDTHTEDDYWDDFEAIDQGIEVIDTMRALFGDNNVADAINEGRRDREDRFFEANASELEIAFEDPNNDPDLDIDFDLDIDDLSHPNGGRGEKS